MPKENETVDACDPRENEQLAILIRPRESTEYFLRSQSRQLGTSIQATIEMILDGFAVLSRPEPPPSEDTVVARFFDLVSHHELSLPQIVDALSKFGFTLSALDNGEALRALLSREVLTHLAELFQVRLDWLTGCDERAIPESHWTADDFSVELAGAHRQCLNPTVTFVRARGGVAGASGDDQIESLVAVVRREHVVSNITLFVTLQVWRFDRWLNEKSAAERIAELTAGCRALAVPVTGIELSDHVMRDLRRGTKLPIQLLSCLVPKTWKPTAPWEQAGATVPPLAAQASEVAHGTDSDPATTIDLYAMLARKQ